ncbi:MAG TPA: NAD(P)H-dependent oxidoreductase subunit E [Candidatus Cloacimonetes bacterium]|nr:NAD(P)H-dependent oxidoreductase subunit E [Candidatus Cloacimonadota bacterium]
MEQDLTQLDAVIAKYQGKPEILIPLLQETQNILGYLSKETMRYLAQKTGIPAAEIYGVATFYSHFSLEPKGKYIIKICDGTACHVRGSGKIIDILREELGLKGKQVTTDDKLFTLEIVSCLGACGLAPVLVIDDNVYGQISAEAAQKLIVDIAKEEESNA